MLLLAPLHFEEQFGTLIFQGVKVCSFIIFSRSCLFLYITLPLLLLLCTSHDLSAHLRVYKCVYMRFPKHH